MSGIMTTVITSFLFTGMGLAQASSSSDRETTSLLVQQVKELKEKVKTLEAKNWDSKLTRPNPTTFSKAEANQAEDRNQCQMARPPCTEYNGNHVNVGLFARPDAIPGLQFGGSFYHDKITNHDFTPAPRLGQSIVNAHIVYVGHGIEFLNEGFLIRHVQEHSQTVFNMPAFY